MLYYATASTEKIRAAMRDGHFGQIVTPRSRNRIEPAVPWVCDNTCFDPRQYVSDDWFLAFLRRRLADSPLCSFAVAPDVPFDHAGTLARSRPMLAPIRELVPVALCAQDGAVAGDMPWDEFDVLFIAGSTEWKLGPDAAALAAAATEAGKQVHMGRVNSGRRFRYAASIGCTSADGTFLAFAPDDNLVRLMRWLDPLAARG